MVAIVYQKEYNLSGPFLRTLEDFLESILDDYEMKDGEVSLVFCDDDFIAELNRQYRGKNGPTDVLSFSIREGETIADPGDDVPESLGDIILSLDRASAQAEEFDVALEEELARLAIHGLLHLLGFDHEESAVEGEMFEIQDEYLSRFMKLFCH